MESLKICLLAFEFPPYPLAGTGYYAINLVKALKGHEVTILTPNHSENDDLQEYEGAEVKRVDMSSLKLLNKISGQAKANRSFIDKKTLFALKVKKYIKNNMDLKDYNLFHSLNERDAAFLDHKHMQKHVPTVISVNDYYILGSSLNPMKFEFKSTDLPLRYVHHNVLKRVYIKSLRNCTKIIPNSHFVGNVVKEATGVGDDKIKVVHRGIDTKKFSIEPAPNKYESKKVLFVGPNAERKGMIFVVKAASKVLQEHPEAQFTLIGSSSKKYKNKINEFIKMNKLENKFTFIEHIPQDELLKYYKDANVFVMPSIMEAMGQVYIEGMSSRTPVIGANVGGVGEIITPDVGYLVKPQSPDAVAEAIKDVFLDKEKAKEMGQKGHERATGYFSVERQMKETIELYKSLAS